MLWLKAVHHIGIGDRSILDRASSLVAHFRETNREYDDMGLDIKGNYTSIGNITIPVLFFCFKYERLTYSFDCK